ncbi:MAG: DVU0298 family protein [Bacillota bacterium]
MPVNRPKELAVRRPGEMPVGSCAACGAVYAYDATGHNLGAAFVEALVFACNGDWDLAWGLLPEEDYQRKIVERYDGETHRIVPGGVFEGRRVAGALYFLRLQQDIREVTAEGVEKELQRAKPISREVRCRRAVEGLTKKQVEEYVRAYQVKPLLEAAARDKKVIRHLQRLLYAGDRFFRLHAADLLGQVAAVIAREDPAAVTALLQGLFNYFEYSAASSWGAVDAIGEIIANAPDIFAGFIPTIYRFLHDEALRPSALRALGRIAKERPDLMSKAAFHVLPYLHSADPETRGYTVWLLGNLGLPETAQALASLRDDTAEIEIYERGKITRKTVGHLAVEALEKIATR